MKNELTLAEIGKKDLESLSSLIQNQRAVEESIANLEAQLDKQREALRRVSEELIPDMMNELGITQMKLDDGSVVTVEPYYAAKIPEDKYLQAFTWLRNNKYDSIIKTKVDLLFGKGEQKLLNKCLTVLRQQKFEFNAKESIHAQTLKAFVRDRIEAGEELPVDLFGVYVGKRTKIKQQ